ncbi:12723_t:CDS:2 [Acaulospora colombiana]|uniref:12723_t:CDS:1 n=1 Tax=Acaulospora colombiana TaxID=27376 RepID=A0ACA9LZR1_9GLOM|nr:12723_t:CDS:2 [Acaulospora colombiana]
MSRSLRPPRLLIAAMTTAPAVVPATVPPVIASAAASKCFPTHPMTRIHNFSPVMHAKGAHLSQLPILRLSSSSTNKHNPFLGRPSCSPYRKNDDVPAEKPSKSGA